MPKDFNAKKAAEELHDAMKGLGTNEKKIINTLSPLDPESIQEVKKVFHDLYHKDLTKEIKSETSGNFETALVALLRDPVDYDAWLLYDAMEGLGTNDRQLVEVLVTRHPDHLKKVVAHFKENYGDNKSLEDWISSESFADGDYKQYLLQLASLNRKSNTESSSDESAKEDAAKLYRAGEGKLGTDEKVFINIFARSSWKHLRNVGEQYAKNHSHSLHTALDKEFDGKIFHALKWTLEFVENRQAFFAKRIHDSFAGLGTDDKHVIRVIISRRHLDLYEIANEYNTLYGKSLKEALHSELSGDYRLLMEKIVEHSE